MKKVLITGGAGFIAHHIIAYMIKYTDWSITTIDRLDISGNLNRLHDVLKDFSPEDKKRLKIVFHDLKAEINSQIISEIGRPNIILHLAAASHVDRSIKYPMEFVNDNVVGTVNLLNFAKELKDLEKFVYFSTDEIFGNAPEGISYSEYDRYNSTNPYSASKAAAEEFCVAYENTYKMPIYITHTMNVFGERQDPNGPYAAVIPKWINSLIDKKKVYINGDGKTSRDFCYVSNVVQANLKAALIQNTKSLNQVYNIAFGDKTSLNKLFELIKSELKITPDVEPIYKDFREGDVRHSHADIRKAKKNLGYNPEHSIFEGIKKTVSWFRHELS